MLTEPQSRFSEELDYMQHNFRAITAVLFIFALWTVGIAGQSGPEYGSNIERDLQTRSNTKALENVATTIHRLTVKQDETTVAVQVLTARVDTYVWMMGGLFTLVTLVAKFIPQRQPYRQRRNT